MAERATVPANKDPGVAGARARLDDADDTMRKRRGELIAQLDLHFAALPVAVRNAFDEFEAAEKVAADARAELQRARADRLTEKEMRELAAASQINALIAVHVMRLRLIRTEGGPYPWRVLENSGRTREVPNFTGDVSAIATAEQHLANFTTHIRGDTPRERYAQELSLAVGGGLARVVFATPMTRAQTILFTLNIRLDDRVPAEPFNPA